MGRGHFCAALWRFAAGPCEESLVNALAAVPQAIYKLRFDAFPYQRYGVQSGTVRWLGPAGLAESDTAAFRARYPGWWFDWNLALTRFVGELGERIAFCGDPALPLTHADTGLPGTAKVKQ